ncbi:MAG: UxaA family hydrolase [Burkholderiales bacterium]|nr:UxaA family hydrolase [Burkholderiales bacterium]
MPRAIVLHPDDNVATLIDSGSAGAACALQGEAAHALALAADIPFGHKVCVRAIAAGAEVVKYGQVIGRASRAIAAGEHVHTHNVEAARGRGDQPGR